jgi:hypothetical protein
MSQIPPTPPLPPSDDFDLSNAAAAPKAWPKVIGIFSIVLGSLGLICNGCGIAGNAINMAMGGATGMSQMPGPDGKPMPMPDVLKPGPIDLAGGVVAFLLGILLLVAGIMLVTRKPVARVLHIGYAAVAVVLTAVMTAHGVSKLNQIGQWAAQNPDDPMAKSIGMIQSFAMAGIAVGVVLGLGYPLFLLVWFLVVKKSTEEITRGVEMRAA